MAQEAGPNSTSPQDDGLPYIDNWPNDEPIVSIRDARRRLALADAFSDDIRGLTSELKELLREALHEAGRYTVEATYIPEITRSVLKDLRPPERWGDAWIGDVIDPGDLWDHARRGQALTRVGAYAGIPSAEVGQVVHSIGKAFGFVFDHDARDFLPHYQTATEQLGAAAGEYQHLRDSIAGRLVRLRRCERVPSARRAAD